jgi:hypothetical protein
MKSLKSLLNWTREWFGLAELMVKKGGMRGEDRQTINIL